MGNNMTTRMAISLAALTIMTLVGCGGNKTVPLAPLAPITGPQGGFAGGGCGAVPISTGGFSPTYFTSLINIGQGSGQFGGGQMGGGQFGGMPLPSSLTLTFAATNTQNQIGVQQPQIASVSGCFNWADLMSFYPQYPGQQQPQQNTAVQVQSQQPVTIFPDGSFRNLVLLSTVQLPSYGMAAQAVPLALFIAGGRINPYQGNALQVQSATVYLRSQPTQFVYSSAQ